MKSSFSVWKCFYFSFMLKDVFAVHNYQFSVIFFWRFKTLSYLLICVIFLSKFALALLVATWKAVYILLALSCCLQDFLFWREGFICVSMLFLDVIFFSFLRFLELLESLGWYLPPHFRKSCRGRSDIASVTFALPSLSEFSIIQCFTCLLLVFSVFSIFFFKSLGFNLEIFCWSIIKLN